MSRRESTSWGWWYGSVASTRVLADVLRAQTRKLGVALLFLLPGVAVLARSHHRSRNGR